MVDNIRIPGPNVVDLRSWQARRQSAAQAMTPRVCRHCGAGLMDGESDDDCSSAGVAAPARLRKFYAD